MTDVIISTFTTGAPSETTIFSGADIQNFDFASAGDTGHIVYTKLDANVAKLYHTQNSLTSLGSWPAIGTHVQITPTYTPVASAPYIVQPKILVNGSVIHAIWSYFTKPYGFLEVPTIGTGYAGGTIGADDIVFYNGRYYQARTLLLSTQIDSNAEVDVLIIDSYLFGVPYDIGMGIPNEIGDGYAGPDLAVDDIVSFNGSYYEVKQPLTTSQVNTDLEVTALLEVYPLLLVLPEDFNNTGSGIHHPSMTMVTEYFISANGGTTWLSEVILDKSTSASNIITNSDISMNSDGTSEESGSLYLSICGYNDRKSTLTTYDNFVTVYKGTLNNFSNPKRLHALTAADTTNSSTSIIHYYEQENDFLVICSDEPHSLNTNVDLDINLPDNENIVSPSYVTLLKTKSSTFTFPPDEPLPDIPDPLPLNALGGVIRNGYEQPPMGNIAVTSTGNIWTNCIPYNTPNLYEVVSGVYGKTLYDPKDFKTVGSGSSHQPLYYGQIVKENASAPYIWYRVKKKNTNTTGPGVTAAFPGGNELYLPGAPSAAVLAGDLVVIQESDIFPNNGAYTSLQLYDQEGNLLKEIDPQSLTCFNNTRTGYPAEQEKVIYDFVVDKNDNLWISYGYYDYNPDPQHWNICKYDTSTDIHYPVFHPYSDTNNSGFNRWSIIDSTNNTVSSCSIHIFTTDSTTAVAQKIKNSVEYHTGITVGIVGSVLTLPAPYTWESLQNIDDQTIGVQIDNMMYGINVNYTLPSANTLSVNAISYAGSGRTLSYISHNCQGNKLSVSKEGDWVAFHGYQKNIQGSSEAMLFNVDVPLATAVISSITYYMPHVFIPSGRPTSISELMNVNTVYIENDTAWVYYQNRNTPYSSGLFNTAPWFSSLYRIPLPVAGSTTQYIHVPFGPSINPYKVSNDIPSYVTNTNMNAFDKLIRNFSKGQYSIGDNLVPQIVSDDNFLYAMYYFINNLMGIDIYTKSTGSLYKRVVLRTPSALQHLHTYYSLDTTTSNLNDIANWSGFSDLDHSNTACTIDEAGTIVYGGVFEFNTATLLKSTNTKILSYHHSYQGTNSTVNAEFTTKKSSAGLQRWVYAGSSWATATKKGKIVEVDFSPDSEIVNGAQDGECMIVEPVLGTFELGDIIKEYDGATDTNVHALLTADECNYLASDAYLLDSYNAHIGYNPQAGFHDKTSGQIYKDGILYISNNTKEIKKYNKTSRHTEELIIGTACTVGGTISLLLDSKLKSGSGASLSWNHATPITTQWINLPGQGYAVDDIVYVGYKSDLQTVKVTAVDSFGGITGFTTSGMDTTVTINLYASNATQNSFYVSNFCKVDVALTPTQNTPAKVATAIAAAITASGYAYATTAGNRVLITYKASNATYDTVYTISNTTDVSFGSRTTKPETKLASPIASTNVLVVSHTMTENISGGIFNRIQDALNYTETNGTAGDWYTILIDHGVWYEDIRPNPAGTTQKCNYIFKALIKENKNEGLCPVTIRGSITKFYNMAWARSGTTVTFSSTVAHALVTGDSIDITSSSQIVPLPIGVYTVTRLSSTTFSVIGVNSGAVNGTAQFTTPMFASQHGRGLIELKESGVTGQNRLMIFEGLGIINNYVPVMTTSNGTGARYLIKRLHSSSIASDETIIFNKCRIYNQWEEIAPPGDANDTHYYNSRGYGYIQNTTAINNFTAVYYNSIMGRSNTNHNQPFFMNDSGTLGTNEKINVYTIGSCYKSSVSPFDPLNYVHSIKTINNNSGQVAPTIGYATNNTTAVTREMLWDVHGHTNITSHITTTEGELWAGYYYLESTFWFDDAGNIQITIPTDVYMTILTDIWTPRT